VTAEPLSARGDSRRPIRRLPDRDRKTGDPGVPALRALGNPGRSSNVDAPVPAGGIVLNLPNLITIARILLVPVIVWAIASGEMQIAFLVFLISGVSDAVDGFLAKRLGMRSDLGAHLDPLADKALIVSIYVALGITEAIPRWIVILVVSRDILIIGGLMLAWFVGKPMKIKPVLVSKLNTVAQIVFACLVLAALAFQLKFEAIEDVVMAVVAALTLASVGFYVREWVRHMSTA
jgi:cardiolipin synthase (CMP-forming)